MSKRKYELTDETITMNGKTLHRIRAVRGINGIVERGAFGGFVESEVNLSHRGGSWVGDSAAVYDGAQVDGDALVCGSAQVFGNARIRGNAMVCDSASVFGSARISGNAEVRDDAIVCGNAEVRDDAKVYNYAEVRDDARVRGDAVVCGYADIRGNADVFGKARVQDKAEICGNARIGKLADCQMFRNSWSSGRWFTCFRTADGGIMWKVGCFYGTGDELIAKAYEDSRLSGKCYERVVEAAEAIFGLTARKGGSAK